jgi:hypothetical protein
MLKIILMTLLFSFISCTKDTPIYTDRDLWWMAVEQDPKVELVSISNAAESKRVLCSNYKIDKCIPGSGRRIKVRLVELIAIAFETEEQARKAAIAYDQYYARNWMFDEVTNEPVLESFVVQAFKAKKPKKELK